MIKQITITLTVLFTAISFAQVKDSLVVDYKAINQTIQQKVKQYSAENILIVMDIDNTILTSDHILGSDFWYQWQTDKLEVKPTKEQKLSSNCLFNEAIGLLYKFGSMQPTDPSLPNLIKQWQQAGITLFALTSRNPDYRVATERELANNGVDLTITEPKTIDNNHLNFEYTLTRKLGYKNGVMMTTGLNKGEMLDHMLGKIGKTYKAIIFIDDTLKNINNVKQYFSNENSIDITLFHFTKIEEERKATNNGKILTEEQAERLDKDWDKIIHTLTEVFPETKFNCSID